MNTAQDLENRVALLEEEVRHLRMQVTREQGTVSGRTAPDFLERFSGLFANDPTFDEVIRLGREWRDADKPQEDQSTAGKESTP